MAEPTVKKISRGSLLFSEGDHSRVMYLIKAGSVRLFMKRNNSNTEIASVRAGEILGELAFLDGNPRSVSAEAMTDCELVEISGPMFTAELAHAASWLKILLKTVVGRLRAANTRIRQLEGENSIKVHSKENGKAESYYQFISGQDFLRVTISFCSYLSLDDESSCTAAGLEVFVTNIFSLPASKTISVLDILTSFGFITINPSLFIKNIDGLQSLLRILSNEKSIDLTKQNPFSSRALALYCSLEEAYYASNYQKVQDKFVFNLSKIHRSESLWQIEDAKDLFRLNIVTNLVVKNEETIVAMLEPRLNHDIVLFKVIHALRSLNEQKRSVTGIVR